MYRVFLILAICFAAGAVAFAQTAGDSGGGSVRRNAQEATAQDRGPAVVEGRVVLAAKEEIAEPVLMRRACGGDRGDPVGYTDSKGRFQFRIISLGELACGCNLVAEVAGFRSGSIPLIGLRTVVRNGAGSAFSKITLTPLPGQNGAFNSVTSLAVPKKAKSALKSALEELAKDRQGNMDHAIRELETAIAIYPEYAAAWSILGEIRLGAGNVFSSEAALKEAMRIDPDYLRPYEPLIDIRIAQNDWDQVDQLADHVLAITPTDATMLWYKALASFRSNRHDEAISFIDKIRQEADADERFPQTHQVLGLIYAARDQYQEAAREYRRFLALGPNEEFRYVIERQLEEWKQLGYI